MNLNLSKAKVILSEIITQIENMNPHNTQEAVDCCKQITELVDKIQKPIWNIYKEAIDEHNAGVKQRKKLKSIDILMPYITFFNAINQPNSSSYTHEAPNGRRVYFEFHHYIHSGGFSGYDEYSPRIIIEKERYGRKVILTKLDDFDKVVAKIKEHLEVV